MSLGGILGTIMSPVSAILDKFLPDADKKLEAQSALLAVQADLASKLVEYERTLIAEQGATIREEAKGSVLQRNWRPIVMLLFAYIIAHNYVIAPVFGVIAVTIPPDMWELLKLGMGGYVVGRSAEKLVPVIADAWKEKKKA